VETMKHKVFFDAECPLCYNVKKIIKALDWTNRNPVDSSSIHWTNGV